jgi:hypothetical protein
MTTTRRAVGLAIAAALTLGAAAISSSPAQGAETRHWATDAPRPGAPATGVQGLPQGTALALEPASIRRIVSDPSEPADFTIAAAVAVKDKAGKGKVVFYDGKTRLGAIKLVDGQGSFQLPSDLKFGKHTIKAVFVPAKAGAKRLTATCVVHWQRAATTTYRVNGEVVETSDRPAITVGGRTTFSGSFAKQSGDKATGTAVLEISRQISDSGWETVKTFKTKLKAGKAAFAWRNTIPEGEAGRASWTLQGAWGVVDDLEFTSGEAADPPDSSTSDSSDSSTSDSSTSGPTADPWSPPKTCRYECVQYGYGSSVTGLYQYGCLQRVMVCN